MAKNFSPAQLLSKILILMGLLASPLAADSQMEKQRIEAVWNAQPGLSETEVFELPPSTSFSKTHPLTLVRLKNSQWDFASVVERIRRTEEIYSQCNVTFSPIQIISVVQAKGPVLNVDEVDSYLPMAELMEKGAITKPVVVLADKALHNEYEGGFSLRPGTVGLKNPLVYVAFLFHSFARSENRSYPLSKPALQGNYEVMAHELAHLLFDKPHMPIDDNLLSQPSSRTNKIDPWQCKLIGVPPRGAGTSEFSL